MKKFFFLPAVVLIFLGCASEKKEPVTNPKDYNIYLETGEKPTYEAAFAEMEFWSQRLRPDTTGVGDLGPLGGAYTTLFESTGDIAYLKAAEVLYKKAMDISANNKDIYARALARNYIAQHRFKEAKGILEASYAGISNKRATEHMLFDVYMELGAYAKADTMLGKVKNTGDYNYLIRLAKWSDHKGDLESAIRYLEKARDIADSRKSNGLRLWSYSNLGDFYGHAGRIEEAYAEYIKTLQLQPDNAYAKKGIAWIVYAYEGNPVEANRILDSLMKDHKVPDYHLFKAEIAEFSGNETEAETQRNLFIEAVNKGAYEAMYTTYLTELYAESNPERAIQLARQELANRATPETYHLLAYAYLMNGNKDEALKLIENHVEGKTFEPMAQYHSALVYKANGLTDRVAKLKKELADASFELGPVLTEKIKDL